MNIAIITAAGSGTRMKQDIPKQFLHVDNKPLVVYSMHAFQQHPSIDAILVVTLDSWIDVLWAYARQFNINKLKWVVPGGETGQESIHNGLVELQQHCKNEDIVIVHDGNRPLVSAEIISDSLATQKQYGNAVASVPCTEVVFHSEDGISSTKSIPREELLRTQTPHVYSLGKLLWAHEQAAEKGIIHSAASCDLMQKLGEATYFSKGSEENIKLTTTDDMAIFKALLNTMHDFWLK